MHLVTDTMPEASRLRDTDAIVPSLSTALSEAWHCYSAAGAPADAKAITRLLPRRANQCDRDVAEAVVGENRDVSAEAIVSADDRWRMIRGARAVEDALVDHA